MFCPIEELFTALLFVTLAVLREVLVTRFVEELVAILADAFVSTLRETPVTFLVELLSVFLLGATALDLREVSAPRVVGEPEDILLVTLVAEDLSTPERLLSIALLLVD